MPILVAKELNGQCESPLESSWKGYQCYPAKRKFVLS
jgi:hypothetical protein